jgi:hypothetical protein
MKFPTFIPIRWALLSAAAVGLAAAQTPAPNFSFFITSAGSGDGANLGGLAGADQICQKLAKEAGSKKKNWKAYLSQSPINGKKAINAKDRIGKGPWYNVKGELMAKDVADLHSDNNKLAKATSLTEKGEVVKGRGDTPNQHDILTGTKVDGTAYPAEDARTCNNWTSNGEGKAQVGHHDRNGGGEIGPSWNAAHPSRGCSQANLVATGGSGRFYCFLTK